MPRAPERVPIRMWFALPGSIAIHAIARRLRDGERARDERPVRAAVGRLVETEAGLAVAARVRLAGADVDRLAGRVVRVDGDRADRVRRDPVRDVLPVRVRRERVRRAPDAAARRADVQRALLRLALRVDGERRYAPRPLGRLDEGLRAEPVDVERRRARRSPTSSRAWRRRARRPCRSPRSRPGSGRSMISSAGNARSAYSSAAAPPDSSLSPRPPFSSAARCCLP